MQQELVYFQQKLDAFGIKLPKSMMDQVREDRLNNVGNRRGAGAAIIEFGAKLSTPNLPMSRSASLAVALPLAQTADDYEALLPWNIVLPPG